MRKKRESDESGNAVEGSKEYFDESEEEDGRGPEGSDLAAEEGCEEGGPDAEEGHEEVWDEVQEALSTMEHEEFDATAEADPCARSQASRVRVGTDSKNLFIGQYDKLFEEYWLSPISYLSPYLG